MKKLVYINNGVSTVFDSQVLALLKYYREKNIFEEIILCFGFKSYQDKEWLATKNTDGIKIVLFKSYPNYPVFNFLIQKSLLKTLKTISSDFTEFFFHIRGEMAAFHLRKIAKKIKIDNINILTDVRGVSKEEIQIYSNSNPILKYFKVLNYTKALNNLQHQTKISTVSHSLRDYLINNYNINKNCVSVNSCLVNNNFKYDPLTREKLRSELNIQKNEILIIFTTGGTAAWQSNETIIKLADLGFKVLNLSRNEIAHKNIITLFIPYDSVPAYLSAADVAFIWRDKNIVNKVASPVKFSEYIACGLPIIHNGTVDLINDITMNNKNGILINSVEEFNIAIIKNYLLNREEQSIVGQSLFGLHKIANSYKSIYH